MFRASSATMTKAIWLAPIDASRKNTDGSTMELHTRSTCANVVKLLANFGATLNNVVEISFTVALPSWRPATVSIFRCKDR
ncbi:hypothetical protein DC522_23490 [Microvirga sp. KLBC 81]|nr:hypothetical protein DC522_23490 [Microvirga sp. KLBC 81]